MSGEKTNRTLLDRFLYSVNFSGGQNVVKIKSACPPKRKKSSTIVEDEKVEKSTSESESKESAPKSRCPKERPYVPPSQICPKSDPPCCYIKMQDPYAPCCCDIISRPPPCPPKRCPDEPREPTCGCDYCKKKYADGKCCDRNVPLRDTTDHGHFQKA